MLVVLWMIWHARRKAIHEDFIKSSLSTKCFVDRFLADLEMIACPDVPRHSQRDAYEYPRWIALPSEFAKINGDAVVSKNTSSRAVVVVARDINGTHLGASTLLFEGLDDPETLEALACREALALASDLSLRKMILARDCVTVMKNLRSKGKGPCGHIEMKIEERAKSIEEVCFAHENTASNTKSHNLTRYVLSLPAGRHLSCNSARGALYSSPFY